MFDYLSRTNCLPLTHPHAHRIPPSHFPLLNHTFNNLHLIPHPIPPSQPSPSSPLPPPPSYPAHPPAPTHTKISIPSLTRIKIKTKKKRTHTLSPPLPPCPLRTRSHYPLRSLRLDRILSDSVVRANARAENNNIPTPHEINARLDSDVDGPGWLAGWFCGCCVRQCSAHYFFDPIGFDEASGR